jgi:hypothetical protein
MGTSDEHQQHKIASKAEVFWHQTGQLVVEEK